jgi:hypothetical protein
LASGSSEISLANSSDSSFDNSFSVAILSHQFSCFFPLLITVPSATSDFFQNHTPVGLDSQSIRSCNTILLTINK